MGARYKILDIHKIADKTIFFDANVLMYLFFTTATQTWQKNYSAIYARLIHQKNLMTFDFLVLSEVVNRAIRLEYDQFLKKNNIKKENLNFKNYRNSLDGQNSLNGIYNIIKHSILPYFSINGKVFSKMDLESFLAVDTLDFNDKAIVSLCSEKEYVLLTNDCDYAASNIDILSSHPRLS